MSLVADSLCRSLGTKCLLDGVSAEFLPGTVTAIVGPNGAGKTTLLRVLSGELRADAGRVTYDGQNIMHIGLRERAMLRAVMTQSSHIVFSFTVEEILLMGWVQRSGKQLKPQLDYLLARCQIEDLLPRTFNTLSGGEQQRVQFARALLQISPQQTSDQSKFLLLDEPTSSLDVGHELTLLEMAREAAANGIAVIVVLHDLNLASRFAHKIVLLRQGTIVAEGVPSSVLQSKTLSESYSTPMTVEFHAGLERLVVYS